MNLHARVRTTSLLLAAAIALAAPAALAQGAGKPAAKPAGKPDPKKAAEDQKKADDAKAADAKAAEDADKKKADDAKAAEDAKKAEEAAKAGPGATVEPPHEEWDIKDVEEVAGKKYLFIGARYRGNIIPKFMLNLFVDEGATVYSNTIAIELDMRKDGFSLIPALGFTEYGTSDILFKQKGEKDIPGNYSFVNSSMKAIYATADLLWSVKINKNFDFEYGAGFGLGIIFGDLANNWVFRDDTNGSLSASNGGRYSKCQFEGQGGPGSGCNKADHKNADIAKVGNYTEPSWFSGGSKPVVFPWLSIPQLGLRYKPIKNFVARLGMGFALTGFWFGLNGEYGLEQKPQP
jgi:hypothetical protein